MPTVSPMYGDNYLLICESLRIVEEINLGKIVNKLSAITLKENVLDALHV